MSEHLQKAEHTLESLRSKQKQLKLSEGIVIAVFLTLIAWSIGILIEFGFNLQTIPRGWLLGAVICASIGAFSYFIWKVISNPTLQQGRFSQEHWALKLGEHAPDRLRDRLLNAIQINRSNRYDHSNDLATEALYQAVADMEDVSLDQVIDLSRRRQQLIYKIGSQIAIVLIFLLLPVSFTDAMDRLLHPKNNYIQAPSFTLLVETIEDWAYRSEEIEFTITADGEAVSSVEFSYQYVGGEDQIENVRLNNNVGKIKFDGFSSSISYMVRHDEITSPEKRLEIVTRPQISELQYRLTPPRYSRMPIEVGQENVGDVETLPGSKLELTIRSTKPLANCWFLFQPNGVDSTGIDSSSMDVLGQTGRIQLTLKDEGRYYVRLRDQDNHPDRDPVAYRIRLMTDEHPSVRILFPDDDLLLGEDMIVPLQVAADDDYGISKLAISYHRLGSADDSVITTFPLKLDLPNTVAVMADEMWEMGKLTLVPGDVVEYWAVAWDNDNINGPKRTESERRLIRLPTIEEIFAGVEESEQAGFDQAEQALESARDLKERVEEVIEEMKRNPEMDWEQRKEIESAIEQQNELQKQVEQLKQKIDELVEQLEKHDLLTMETLEKYQQLQELLAEIATPEMKEAMEKIQQAMEKQDPEALRKAMEQFDMDREEFLQNIERSLSILEQLQLERKMDELVKQAEELLHRQEEILAEMEENPSEELAKQQESLANSTDNFKQNMESAKKLAEDADETALADALDSLMNAMDEKQLSSNMRQTAQDISAGNMESAKPRGEQSARDLSEMASQLSNAGEAMKQNRKDELEDKLRRLTEELLYVSQAQESLADESERTGTHSPRFRGLAGQQEDIRNSLSGVTGRLFEVSRETFFVTPSLGAKLGKASEDMGSALDKYSDRNPRSVAKPQESALGNINQAARELLDALGQMQGSSSSSGYEEMMEKLSEMAQQQSGLNQQSSGMPMPGEGQQMPGSQPMPGNQGMQGMGKMAAQQRALQQGMQKLSEEGQGMQDILGDLDGVAKSMGEVAGDMEEKNINQRTRRLQRQIVSRLLDATRSVREQEYSRKRESISGKDLVRKSPKGLQFDKDKDQLRRDLLRALQEGYTRDYRALIRAYYQQLEQTGDRSKQ